MRCPRKSRKKSKTRCFNEHDVVVHRTPGRCPRGSRKTSKTRCFDEHDNEIIFTPPNSLYAPNSQNSYVPGSQSPPYVPSPYAPNSPNSYVPGSQSPPYVPVHPGNLALQANQGPQPSIHTIPPYMLNHIQRFVGPETTRGYMNPQELAMLNQNIPSIGHMMFNFLFPNKFFYPGGEPRIKNITHLSYDEFQLYKKQMFDLFKDYVRQTYIANKVKPIPLTPQEEQLYKAKLDTMVVCFKHGHPLRDDSFLFLVDTTGTVPRPRILTLDTYELED